MTNKRKCDQSLSNQAKPSVDDSGKGAPVSVGETLIFSMKDNFHVFSLDLETVLSCLAFAEKEGAVPALPEGWWLSVCRRYGL